MSDGGRMAIQKEENDLIEFAHEWRSPHLYSAKPYTRFMPFLRLTAQTSNAVMFAKMRHMAVEEERTLTAGVTNATNARQPT